MSVLLTKYNAIGVPNTEPISLTYQLNKRCKNLPEKVSLHLRAMKLLAPGGILSTFCCSHHAGADLFRESVLDAAIDAPATLRLIQQHGQRPDHPILLNIPETEYLKGFTYELLPGR